MHDPVDRQQRGAGLARAAGESSAPALPPRAKAEHDRSRILLEAARRMRDRTWELLESAEHHEQKAEMHVRRLLPHAWLWSSDGELDLSLLDRSDLGRRREWERKLDDLHARALLLWSWLRFERALREEQEAAEQKAAATESDGARAGRLALSRLRLRKAEQERRVRPHEVFRALELCRRHFWPNDLDLLRLFSESEWDGEESREFCAETLQRVTRHTFERDPVFWSLWHLADDAPDVAEVLRSAAEQRGIPPYMYVWLGWRLDGLERPDFALIAYGNALRSQQSDMLLDLADRLAEGGHWSVRRRALGRAMAADRVRHGPDAPLDDLYPREIGRSLWQVGRHDRAVAWFARVSGENETGAWRTALVSEVVSNGPRSKETYRLLKRWLGHDLTRAQGNGRPRTAMRRDAAAALLLLTHSWYQEVVHREWDPDRSTLEGPAATPPIVIEADPGFFPSGPKSRAAKQLLEKELPAMRTDIADETGVEIPPISIHPTPGLGEGRYRLYLNEVPLVDQVLAPEQRYFVKEAEAGGLTGLPDQDPLTAAAGLWLRRRPDGIAAYNRSTYIARRLRSLVLAHLDELLSTEEAMRLLDRWSEDDGGSEERRAIRAIHLDDERRRTRFVRLLRAVAAERIPLTDLDPIVRTFVEAPDDADTVEVAERARGALRVAERMIDPSKVADALPPQVEDRLEDWIYEDAGRRVLAPPTEIADELRSQVKDALLPGGTSALIVLRAGLRPFVRRIVAQVDPRLDVLARSELRDVVLLAHESTSQSVDEVATP